MKSLMRIKVILLIFSIVGCFGRHDDKLTQSVGQDVFSLSQKIPSVIVFSALWCKPCLAEIDHLNEIQDEFSNQLQIKSFIVEGIQKGSTPSMQEVDQKFVSPLGLKPNYTVELDPNWEKFSRAGGVLARQLPTMMFLDSSGNIVSLTQRTLDLETELRPILQRLIAGLPVQPTPSAPDPEPTPDLDLQKLRLSEWILRPGNSLESEITKNLRRAWVKGRSGFGFTSVNMPFDSGEITFFSRESGSANSVDRPRLMEWSYESDNGRCSLSVLVRPDGTYLSSSGVCV